MSPASFYRSDQDAPLQQGDVVLAPVGWLTEPDAPVPPRWRGLDQDRHRFPFGNEPELGAIDSLAGYSPTIVVTHDSSSQGRIACTSKPTFPAMVITDSPTGPFESLGKFRTQNIKLFKTPYQEFKFPAIKAKYLKIKLLSTYGGDSPNLDHPNVPEVQLFGRVEKK